MTAAGYAGMQFSHDEAGGVSGIHWISPDTSDVLDQGWSYGSGIAAFPSVHEDPKGSIVQLQNTAQSILPTSGPFAYSYDLAISGAVAGGSFDGNNWGGIEANGFLS